MLTPATRLGPYEILAPLGAGGMGEVWRARDTRLGREVAIKALPEGFADDPERHARFEREAKLLASLNHPNVATLHALEDVDGLHLLVMELVEGDDLSALIARGPLPLADALPIAKQIADALEAAHERGIVHRDLKPGNVKVRPDGTVKVLDFGLAKAWEEQGGNSDLALSPTITGHHTRAGVILGTAAYMSPEQARGKPVDKRADIWAFGCLFYEMLTGKRLFAGETISDTLAAVLRQEVDWAALPPGLPPSIRPLLARCLERDPKRRLRDIGEGRIALAEALATPGSPVSAGVGAPLAVEAVQRPLGSAAPGAAPTTGGTRSKRTPLPWVLAVAAILLAAVFAALYLNSARQRNAGAGRVMRFQIVPARGERLAFGSVSYDARSFAISPDGTKLAYVVNNGASTQLRLRSLDAAESAAIPQTEGAQSPFFSPDGKWLAFTAGPNLKKVAVSGGTPVTLAGDAPSFRGGVWAEDDWIYFVPNMYVPVFRVPATGGAPERVTKIRAEEGEQQHRWPELLPDGKTLLYAAGVGGEWDDARIVAERLDTGERKVLVKGGTYPRYLPTGHLVYARGGSLYALAFDAKSLAVKGSPVEVARDVLIATSGFAAMDFSRSGMLVTAPTSVVVGDLMLSWVDRAGRGEPLKVAHDRYYYPASISPDGRRVAIGINNSIAVVDLDRLVVSKLTLPGRAENSIWSGDGRRLYFGLEKGRHYQVFSKAADDSGAEQIAFASEISEAPLGFSSYGSRMLTYRSPPDGQEELVVRELERGASGGGARVLFKSPYFDDQGTFSPDGRYVAYQSEESGRPEIYVRPASGEDRKWQVSSEGGTYPVWSPDGKEIFYLCGMKLLAAPVNAGDSELRVGTPQALFENHEISFFDVSRDGKRFFVTENPSPGMSSHLDLVLGWFSEVRQKVQEARAP